MIATVIGIATSDVTIAGMAGGEAMEIATAMTVGIVVAGAIAVAMIVSGIVTTGAIAATDGIAIIAIAIMTTISQGFTTEEGGLKRGGTENTVKAFSVSL